MLAGKTDADVAVVLKWSTAPATGFHALEQSAGYGEALVNSFEDRRRHKGEISIFHLVSFPYSTSPYNLTSQNVLNFLLNSATTFENPESSFLYK